MVQKGLGVNKGDDAGIAKQVPVVTATTVWRARRAQGTQSSVTYGHVWFLS